MVGEPLRRSRSKKLKPLKGGDPNNSRISSRDAEINGSRWNGLSKRSTYSDIGMLGAFRLYPNSRSPPNRAGFVLSSSNGNTRNRSIAAVIRSREIPDRDAAHRATRKVAMAANAPVGRIRALKLESKAIEHKTQALGFLVKLKRIPRHINAHRALNAMASS